MSNRLITSRMTEELDRLDTTFRKAGEGQLGLGWLLANGFAIVAQASAVVVAWREAPRVPTNGTPEALTITCFPLEVRR